jgi:sterol desaturase/sphingolipid hydroxylase (fatty acid hydroxylase superfamily)
VGGFLLENAMNHLPIDKSKDPESIRLFQSDFLEFFTHISPVAVTSLWAPVALMALIYAIWTTPRTEFPWFIPIAVLAGFFLWTFAEYTLHRFLFHHHPTTPRQERIFFLFHGIHHAQPQDKTRLVMPLPVSIPISVIFVGLFYSILGMLLKEPQWVAPLTSGFLIGYLAYDLTHYATHHFPMRSGYAKYIKRHHMAHHYKNPESRFGVSSPVWDWVFGTTGREQPERLS